MKILVTGAYGQLGKEIEAISEVYGEFEFLFTDVDTLDITQEEEVNEYFDIHKPQAVINCAAYTAVDKAESDKEAAEKINVLAPGILAKAAATTGAKMIHVSTDYVFGGGANLPYVESDDVDPNSVYGETKLQGEILCLETNPDSVILRTSWLYSAYGNNFVKTMLRLGRERGELNVVFDQVGTPTYAGDLAVAILNILRNGNFVPGIYHYSNEGVASWYDFALAVFELSSVKCKVSPVTSDQFPSPAKRPAFSVLNKGKIKSTYGTSIPYWRESLKICIEKIQKEK